jgi:hypothetical protein
MKLVTDPSKELLCIQKVEHHCGFGRGATEFTIAKK